PKIPRVGCVFAHTPTIDKDVFEAFRRALRELGYVEGQTIVLEARWAEDGRACRSQCGCPGGGEHPRIGGGQECYPDHPIVMMTTDPVALGLVGSLSRPGGNVTGLSYFSEAIMGKRLELLKEVVPGLARVGVLRNPLHPADP